MKKVRKIAVERHTTLTALVRSYLETLAAEEPSDRKQRGLEALRHSFEVLHFERGDKPWTRADLYERR